jgi:hypothetical protein
MSLISNPSSDLHQLVAASELDPAAGDLADIDLGGINLSGQNLSGWDLRHAKFKDAILTGTELHESIVDPFALVEAQDWEQAHLDDNTRTAARGAATYLMPISTLGLSERTKNCLLNDRINRIGDLVLRSEAGALRIPNFGRKSLNEIKEVLAGMGLHLGMEIPGWPTPRR